MKQQHLEVFVTRRLPEPAEDRLREFCLPDVWSGDLPPPRDVLLERARGKAGLLTLLTDTVDEELLLAAGPSLRVVSNLAIGVDNVDVPLASSRGVMVCNTPDVLTETTADLAFALLLAVSRRLVEAVDFVRRGAWQTWDPRLLLGRDVAGATLGIVGLGRIGRAVGRRARGFDMRLRYLHPRPVPEVEGELNAHRAGSLKELLTDLDFLSLHVPLSEHTRHLLNRETLAWMPRSAVVINTARGPLIDTAALTAALASGRLAGAGLDVTDPEPLPADHPLLSLPNCVVVPHIGSASEATRRRMALQAVENLRAGLQGERPMYVVNPQGLNG